MSLAIMKSCICLALSAALLSSSFGAVRGEHAAYVGGTVASLKQGVEGTLDTSDGTTLTFEYKGGEFSLPYKQIATLEFGEKVGHRVGATIAGMIALGLPGLIILASKKKKHFLTIGYHDQAGNGQASVPALASLPIDRQGVRCLPRLCDRSRQATEAWRCGCAVQHAVAVESSREGKGQN